MKKYLIVALIAVAFFACKKEAPGPAEPTGPMMIKKYARYNTNVFEDAGMKKWIATLSKAEEVEYDPSQTPLKDKDDDIVIVNLTDGKKGHVALKHFADKPVVFTEDTKAHVRNNIASKVDATIPKGSIGFIIEEKGEWVQIYIGKVNDIWITKHWIKSGFSSDENLLVDAKIYEEAMRVISDSKSKSSDVDKAKKRLEEMNSSGNIFSELAAKKLEELAAKASEPAPQEEAPAPEAVDGK